MIILMQKKQTVSRPAIISARRWMTAGLAVSVVGTQVANGTGPGSVAVGLLPVAFLAILATVEEGLAIASPLIAKLVLGKSPAKLLVATDAVEAVLAGAAVLVLFTAPRYAGLTLMFYLLAACACPVVSDLLEEFYGQQIAELDAHEAMTYNTHIYSLLSFISLVVAMPAGAWLAGISLRAALLVNFSLSAVAVCFRYFSSRTVLPGSFDDQEASEEFSLAGQREPLNQFLHDLIGAGPISPLISLINSFAAASSGVYVYLWFAHSQSFVSRSAGLSWSLAAFGVGATLGPWLGSHSQRRIGWRFGLVFTNSALAIVALLAMVGLVPHAHCSFAMFLAVFFLIGLFSRGRMVILSTLRQVTLHGKQFARVASWALAFSAVGQLVGSWFGVVAGISNHPERGFAAILAAAVITLLSTLVSMRGAEPTDIRAESR